MSRLELDRKTLLELCSEMKIEIAALEEFAQEGDMKPGSVQKKAGQMFNVVNKLRGEIKKVKKYALALKEQKRERIATFTLEQVAQYLADPVYPKRTSHRKARQERASKPCFHFSHPKIGTRLVSLKRAALHAQMGLQCTSCPRVGVVYHLELDNGGGLHLDLYSEDDCLMTIDHIHPASKGGPNTIDNYQMMCRICNTNKGATVPGENE